ncbi:MAG: ABC transporter substrate-binding protein [Lachnospiraceae bacterium]|nr:ABC transporter substrate-binding protein [Lachnospiraceae bacterium]
MKITKKFLSLTLALVMAASLLTGCGANDSQGPAQTPDSPAVTNDSQSTNQSAENVQETAALERVTIDWYIVGETPTDAAEVNALVSDLLNDRYGLNVDFNLKFFGWGDFDDRMTINFQTGEPMDIVFATSWGAYNHFPPLAANGALYPLNDLLESYGQDIVSQLGGMNFFDGHIWRGEIYGVPVLGDMVQLKGLTFRADLVDKYDFDYKSVKTLADIEPFLQTILDNEPGITPLYIEPTNGMEDFGPGAGFYDSIGNPLVYNIASGEVIPRFDAPETVELFHMMRDFYQKGYLPRDIASRTDLHAESASGNYAVMTSPSFMNDGLRSSELWGYPCYDVQIPFQQYLTTAGLSSCTAAIPSSSLNPERAMMVMNAVWKDADIFNILSFGIQGTHWDFNNDGVVYFGAEYGNEGWGGPYHWMVANAFNRYPTTTESQELWDAMEARTRSATPSPIAGFTYDSSELRTENAQIDAIIVEMQSILYTGSADVDSTLSDVRDRLIAAGINEVVADVNQQLATWKAENNK